MLLVKTETIVHTSTAYTRLMEVCESKRPGKSIKRCNRLWGGGEGVTEAPDGHRGCAKVHVHVEEIRGRRG